MKLKAGHIVLAVLLLLLLFPGCGRRGRIIPARKMAEIYVDMFLADQWVSDNYTSRRVADTSDFYGPIFKAHGYTFKDYDRSVSHYLENPDNFSRMLDRSADILEKRTKSLKDEQTRREKVEELERYLRENLLPRVDFEQDDTLLWRPDTLSASCDSLAAASLDSLAAAVDSLAMSTDSLSAIPVPAPHRMILDTVNNVKGRDSFRTDSFKETRKFARD